MKKKIPILLAVLLLVFQLNAELRVTRNGADIRRKADVSGKVLLTVAKGTLLVPGDKSADWFYVALPGKSGSTPPTYGYIHKDDVEKISLEKISKNKKNTSKKSTKPKKPKDKIFLMGMGMLRLNWASVKGNDIRFRYSDLGLPTELSTRERASFMVDGTFGHKKYNISGHVNYDPENRITEPPLEFLLNVGNDTTYLSAGDYRMGVMLDSVFTRYYHSFRGGIIGARSKRMGIEVLGGLARGESGIEEFPADAGTGPYYLVESPILRGSETLYMVTKSLTNPDLELKRTQLVRNRDYFIDYDRGSILFTNTLYGYDEMGNPVSILASYQYESLVGRFSRAVFGFRAFAVPIKPVKLTASYIADSDKDQSLGDIVKNARSIFSLGLNVDSKALTLFGEFAFNAEKNTEKEYALFTGGILTISKKVHFFFNGWKVDSEFPTFANRQLQYGYSLFQIFPSYAQRNIFLSPFQFTRNLGAELYPFTLSRLSLDETEGHGFMEYETKTNRISAGYGFRDEATSGLHTDTVYASTFHNGEKIKYWAKSGMERSADDNKTAMDTRVSDVLLGVRQRVKKFSKGEIYAQADFKGDWTEDYLDLNHDIFHTTYSISAEYLTGSEGIYAGYRKEHAGDRDDDRQILDADIFEMGIRRHVYKGFFLDCRFRQEESSRDEGDSSNKIVSLGVGFETKKFRSLAKYETQLNETGDNKGKRKLWSIYLFGSPLKRMSISLRYYNQIGEEEVPLSVNERSEEQLTARFLWRPWAFLNLYSQWRYDTNLELYPPLDRTKSNSLATVQGVKVKISKKLEFLANYKLLKVWGPIDNRKYSVAAELGYLLFKHFRVGLGVEQIDFYDRHNPGSDYKSTVGYFKLVAIY
ncbi:MAG: hypothetical protein GY757_56630 [bacterium]|nr:hypothetical protein [bacterium]